jgi:hypothetical protein
VTYTLRVARGAPEATSGPDSNLPASTVWRRTLDSTQYGTPEGALTFVGACDASDQDLATPALETPNSVYLTLDGIDAPTPLASGVDFVNPCPASAPCVQTANCLENQDTLISYNLTVMRRANQGFFDVAVNFSDIFCSGKVDCNPALLHDSNAARARTTVAAFACTSGADLDDDPTNDTHLFVNDLVVHCRNGSATDAISVLDLAADGGRHDASPAGGAPEAVDTFAIYGGIEQLEGYRKGYWNLALTLAPNQSECTLTGAATAAAGDWPMGTSPANTIYPVILFDDIALGASNSACHEAHPLDGPGSDVHTAYTSNTPRCFGNVGVILPMTLDRSDTSCGLVDPCDTQNGGCHALTTCYDAGGQAYCGPCPAGYTGTGATGCVDIDECATNHGGCDLLTTCTNAPGSYGCGPCPSGYTGTGATGCTDIDECATNHGGCDLLTTCTNTAGARTCGACPDGYDGDGYVGCTLRVPVDVAFVDTSLDLSVSSSAYLAMLPFTEGVQSSFPGPSRVATLSSSDPSCVSVPPTVTLTAGSTSRAVAVTAGPNACEATITVSDPIVGTDVVTVRVNPPPDLGPLTLTSFDESKVGAGLQSVMTVAIPSGRSNPGPVAVTITSSDPSIVSLATTPTGPSSTSITVTIGATSNSAAFYVRGLPGQAGKNVRLTATHPRCALGTSDLVTVSPVVSLYGLMTSRAVSTAVAPAEDGLELSVGITLANGSIRPLAVAPGLGLPVTVSVSGNGSARIRASGGLSASLTAYIAPGETKLNPWGGNTNLLALVLSNSPTPGTYTVSLASPVAVVPNPVNVAVTVTTSRVALSDPSSGATRVGVGLQSQVKLDLVGSTGGVTVTLESADSSRVYFSTSPTVVGSPTLDVTFSSGSTSRTVYVQTPSSAELGNVLLRATCPGYGDGEITYSLIRPVVRIDDEGTAWSGTTYTNLSNDFINFGWGVPSLSAPTTSLVSQWVSPIGGQAYLTVTKTASSMANLASSGQAGDSVQIPVSAGTLGATSNAVWVDFAYPAVNGSFSYTATLANTDTSFPPGTVTVTNTISPATLGFDAQLASNGNRVGGGLYLNHGFRLNTSEHGGVTVRISSSNPSVLKVATTGTSTQSAASIDYVIPSGGTAFSFSTHGVTGATGTASVSIECITPGCLLESPAARTVTVVPVIPVISATSYTLNGSTIDPAARTNNVNVSLRIRDANNNLAQQQVAGSMAPFPVDVEAATNLDTHIQIQRDGATATSTTAYLAADAYQTGIFLLRVAPNPPAGAWTGNLNAKVPGTDPSTLASSAITVNSAQVYLSVVPVVNGLPFGLVDSYTVDFRNAWSVGVTPNGSVTVSMSHESGAYLGTSYTTTTSQSLERTVTSSSTSFYMMGSGDNRVSIALTGTTPVLLNVPDKEATLSFVNQSGLTVTSETWGGTWTQRNYGIRLSVMVGSTSRTVYAGAGGYVVGLTAYPSGICSALSGGNYQFTVPAGSYQITYTTPAFTVFKAGSGACEVAASHGAGLGTNALLKLTLP